MSHIQAVQEIYSAFQRGDVPAILARVSEHVDWRNDGVESRECPWNGNFSGRSHLPGFFSALAEHLEFTRFDVKEMLASESSVAVHLRIECVVRTNSRPWQTDAMHLWTFDDHGRVSSYRHFNDTAAELKAWRG